MLHSLHDTQEQTRNNWFALEDIAEPAFQELASKFGYRGGVLSRFNVRLGTSKVPTVFQDYKEAVSIIQSHGITAFGRPTSRDRIHYDDTPRGTVTVEINNNYYDVCMFL